MSFSVPVIGVFERELMIEIVDNLSTSNEWKPGDRVKTLRGSARGVVVRQLDDGRLLWRVDGGAELTASADSLIPDN